MTASKSYNFDGVNRQIQRQILRQTRDGREDSGHSTSELFSDAASVHVLSQGVNSDDSHGCCFRLTKGTKGSGECRHTCPLPAVVRKNKNKTNARSKGDGHEAEVAQPVTARSLRLEAAFLSQLIPTSEVFGSKRVIQKSYQSAGSERHSIAVKR